MKAFLQLPAERRRLAFQQVDETMGLQAFSVEKDFWVCWTLRELFALPDIGALLTFKGGTSLSKAWKLIERFSEDIDLIVGKDALGFGGDASPDKAPSQQEAASGTARCAHGDLSPVGAGQIAAGLRRPHRETARPGRLDAGGRYRHARWAVFALPLPVCLPAGRRRLCAAPG